MAPIQEKTNTVCARGDSEDPPLNVNQAIAQKPGYNCDNGDRGQNPAYDPAFTQLQSKRSDNSQTPDLAFSSSSRGFHSLNSQPTKSNSRRLIEVSKRQPCNICGRTEGYCKVDTANDQWFCSQTVDSVRVGEVITGRDGGRWARIGGKSDWALFRLDQPRERTNQPIRSVHPRPKPQHPVIPLLGVSERDEAFSRMLELLTLEPEHHADLRRRGFTDDQIQAAGFRSITTGFRLTNAPEHLPGFVRGQYKGKSGFLLPIRTIDGLIVGFQTRSVDGYRWASIEGNYRLPCDEPPLVFLPGATKQIFLAEGTGAKPAFINQTTGSMVVGASGGRWNGSPKQIAELVAAHPKATFTLLPDAGSTLNPRITDNYRQTAELFSRLGVELNFQWWNQLEKGTDPDADETAFWGNGIQLLSTEFFSDEFRQRCDEQIEIRRDRNSERTADKISTGRFLEKGCIPAPADAPLVVLKAPMGSGKTEVMVEHIHNSGLPTLSACHRRNLSRNFSSRTGTIPHRQDGELFCPTSGNLITTGVPTTGDSSCIDSWHPGSSIKRTPEEFKGKLVNWDEADQGSDHTLRGETCKQFRSDIIDTLREGLPLAAQTVIASGTMDDLTINLFEQVTGHKAHIVEHISEAPRWSYSLLETPTQGIHKGLQMLNEGKKVLFSVAHAGGIDKNDDISATVLLEYFRQQCPELNETNSDAFTSESIRLGEEGSRQKLFMRDPVSAVQELHLAIYSPVAETGVDINLQGHFDAVFCLDKGFTQSAQSFVQSCCRLRDAAAHRYIYVPNSRPKQRGHGITDPQKLIAVTLKDAARHNDRLNHEGLVQMMETVFKNDSRPSEDPFLQMWAKLEIRSEREAKHHRFTVLELLSQFGAEQKPPSVITTADKEIGKAVRAFCKEKKSEAAKAVITAPMPGTPEFEVAKPEQKVAGRRRQKIELTTGKTLTTANTSEAEVVQTEKAIGPLKQRFLMENPELADVIDAERLKGTSKWAPDRARALSRARVDALVEMGARALLQPRKIWTSFDAEVIALNEYLGDNSADLRRWFGGKARQYNDPIRALKWLVKVVGMKTESMELTRIKGRQITPLRVLESTDEVNVDAIFDYWRKKPAIVTGVTPALTPKREPLQTLEPVNNSLTSNRKTSDLVTPTQLDLPDWCRTVPTAADT